MPALSVPKTPSIGFAIASETEHDCRVIATAFLFVGGMDFRHDHPLTALSRTRP